MLRKFFVAVPVVALAVGGTTACASKKFVRTSVGEVNGKVDSLGRSVEETQERTRRNVGKISADDRDRRRRQGGSAIRRVRYGQSPPRVRSGAERGPGQLQVRPDPAS